MASHIGRRKFLATSAARRPRGRWLRKRTDCGTGDRLSRCVVLREIGREVLSSGSKKA